MNSIDQKFLARVADNNLQAVISLLKGGANVHTDINRALKLSAELGHLDMVLKLLEYGANLHVDEDHALRWSVGYGRESVVNKLLEMGASVNINRASPVFSALELSVKFDGSNINIVTKLLECGADVYYNDDCALRVACKRERFEIVAKLLEHGANVHCSGKVILKNLQKEFNEQMADIILPYCDFSDYEYFPADYICKRIRPTKNANTNI